MCWLVKYVLSKQKKALQYPPNIWQGFRRALTIVLAGSLSGIASTITMPVMLALRAGWKGGILGGILGLTVATLTVGSSIIYGGMQLVVGLIRTPIAVGAYFGSKRYDPDLDDYIMYFLNDEVDELSSLRSNGGDVYDLTYYQTLGVEPNATSRQIKRAYFQRAKEIHPDKNPSDKAAAEKFLKIHKAYQTLMDDEGRAAYDEAGLLAEDSPPFDAHVFFAILFGSQAIEPYIGDLSVASFWDQIIRCSTSDIREELMLKMIMESTTKAKERRRQVDITINLWNKIEPYVSGKLTKEDFRIECQREADKIAKTPYGESFLEAIGSVIKLNTGIYTDFRNPLRTPRGIFYRLAREKRDWVEFFGTVTQSFRFLKNIANKRNGDGTISQESMESLLPEIVSLAWKFVLRDVSYTLQEALSRLLGASDLPGKRFQRAKALQVLAEAFLSRVKKNSNRVEDDTSRTVRCKVAFQIAQHKVSSLHSMPSRQTPILMH